MTRFWTGGYGPDHRGALATGIGVLVGDEGREPTTLAYREVAAAPSPAWLAQHPTLDVVYAALEDAGQVQAFARTGELSLTPLGAPVPVGEAVCHLAVNQDAVFASCYGDGQVVRIALDAAGRLGAVTRGAAVARDESDDLPLLARSNAVSRAHATVFLPDGRIATADLGVDRIRIWRSDFTLDHEVHAPLGVGPRHFVMHPSGHLHVLTEYSGEIFTLAPTPSGRWAIIAAVSTGALPGDAAAELALSRNGEMLYAGLRGSNTIAALRVRGAGEIVEPVALAESGVNWPRHHIIYDGLLLVTGQRSNEVAVLDVDERTGAPGRIRHRTAVPTPTHLLPVR